MTHAGVAREKNPAKSRPTEERRRHGFEHDIAAAMSEQDETG
jgi:hypothetical protein